MTVFDFTPDSSLADWRVVDDGVMGGLSQGRFGLTEEGHGRYVGHVSLENNGGFSSLRYQMPTVRVEGRKRARLRVKGDGKRYQFRVKRMEQDRHSYVAHFTTSGEWEEIVIPLADMEPQWRGRQLDLDNYPADMLTEVAFLIGNKKEQDFTLLLDWIRLE